MSGSSDLASTRRTHNLRRAVLASTVSKASGFLLQLLSLPLVYNTLSTHAYAIFLLVSAVLGTLNLTQLGTGAGLTQEIAKAAASDDRESEARYFAASFALTASIVAIASAALLATIYLVPAETLLGAAYRDDDALIVSTGSVCVILIAAHILFGNVDSALAGYQEQAYTSIGSLVSNLTAAGLIVYVCQGEPTIMDIILAAYCPPTVTRILNLIVLLFRRPYLVAGFSNVSWQSVKLLLGAGLAFWLIQLASVVEQNAPFLILGRCTTPADLTLYGVVYKAILLALSAMNIVTQPLWPALIDARLRRDMRWIRRLLSVTRRWLMSFAVAISIGLIVVGALVFKHLLHVDLGSHARSLLLVFALYVTCNTWAHVHYMSLMGLSRVSAISIIIVTENAVMLVLGFVFTPWLGICGMALSHLLASMFVPAWYLPMRLRRALQELETRPSAAVAELKGHES
jgi:O-antigen/teichoic acid export membrane protein